MAAPVAVRPLGRGDLEAVVALDAATSGGSRRGFFSRRVGLLESDPSHLVGLAAERQGKLIGFLAAHLLDGEFGGEEPVGVLDAIGVAEAERGAGVATGLLERLEQELVARKARELRTQVEWTAHGMASFFASTGFRLAGRLVLEREVLAPFADEFQWEDLPVRSLAEQDLPAVVRIDRHITGRDRSTFYRRRAAETLMESGIRLSLVAEADGQAAGFLMARIDYGEFGQTESSAVLDAVGVDPGYGRRRLGRALLEQLLLNLRSLRVERVITEAGWDEFGLLAFLAHAGFGPSQRLSFQKAIGGAAARSGR
jgi:ribosomal protein S18 acetylase RimI-like enzyme